MSAMRACVFLALVVLAAFVCGTAAAAEDAISIPKPWKKNLGQRPAKAGAPWTDLLAGVDARRHGRFGAWSKDADGLSIASTSPARLVLPANPAGDYQLRIELTRKADGPLGVVLPVGKRQCALLLGIDGTANGLETLEGRPATNNASTFQAALTNGRKYRLEIAVKADPRNSAVTVTLDDRPLLFYRGPANALALPLAWRLPPGATLGLAAQCEAVFHKVDLREAAP